MRVIFFSYLLGPKKSSFLITRFQKLICVLFIQAELKIAYLSISIRFFVPRANNQRTSPVIQDGIGRRINWVYFNACAQKIFKGQTKLTRQEKFFISHKRPDVPTRNGTKQQTRTRTHARTPPEGGTKNKGSESISDLFRGLSIPVLPGKLEARRERWRLLGLSGGWKERKRRLKYRSRRHRLLPKLRFHSYFLFGVWAEAVNLSSSLLSCVGPAEKEEGSSTRYTCSELFQAPLYHLSFSLSLSFVSSFIRAWLRVGVLPTLHIYSINI